ncbi:MAG: fatty acid desaturase [Myxococcota bacterium]
MTIDARAGLAEERVEKPPARVFAHSPKDLGLALLAPASVGLLAASAPLALGAGAAGLAAWGAGYALWVWWGSNTIAHNHLHNPLFTSRSANRGLALFLTATLSIPQTLWRDRHLAHHAGVAPRLRLGRRLLTEFALVFACLGLLAWLAPLLLAAALLPGLAVGLGLCALQGRYEHRREHLDFSDGVSTYGWLHNAVWFNDGHHAEHHQSPRRHWSKLPAARLAGAPVSARAPMMRIFLAEPGRTRGRVLAWLERLALKSPPVQRFLVQTHARALGRLLPRVSPTPPTRVLIVGGGLFPRTALALAELLPDATLVLLDAEPAHLDGARAHLAARGLTEPRVRFRHGVWRPGASASAEADPAELVVVPLAFEGDRDALFRPGPVPRLVHAFPWDREARGLPAEPISRLLLGKRLVAVGGASTSTA